MRAAKVVWVSTGFLLGCTSEVANEIGEVSDRQYELQEAARELLIQYRPGTMPADKSRARGRAGAAHVEDVSHAEGDLELVRVPPGLLVGDAIQEVAADPAVRFAEPNWVYHHQAIADDPYYTNGSLWGMYGDGTTPKNVYGSQAGEAWAAGVTGSRVVHVGVIDEGIQYDHPDLAGNIWTNPFEVVNGRDDDGNGYVDDVHGWDFANRDSSIYDGGPRGKADAHGTHVAGTIGARGGNGAGVAGVSWSVTCISAKFLGRRGGTTANAVKALDYLVDLKGRHGLNIVATNNSWGGGGFSQALLDAITRAARANILFVVAAGNGGSDGVGDDNDAIASYPSRYDTTAGAGYDAVIAVAAITSTGARSSFSNYGATTVDLGAPGSSITSTVPVNGYASYSGTSMATPHVTGAAALYASIEPQLSARELKARILDSAIPTPALAGKTTTGGRLAVVVPAP